MRIKKRFYSVGLVVVLGSLGCNPTAPESVSDPIDKRTGKSAASSDGLSADRSGVDLAVDSTYELSAQCADRYPAGSRGTFGILLRPRGPYHINQQFPTSVTMTAPSTVSLDKTRLLKPDAEVFSEQKVRFEIPFSSQQKGEHKLNALVNFAVCTAKTCIPLQKNLTITLKVD